MQSLSVFYTTKQHFHYILFLKFINYSHTYKNKPIDCAICAQGMCSTELVFINACMLIRKVRINKIFTLISILWGHNMTLVMSVHSKMVDVVDKILSGLISLEGEGEA